MLSGPFKSLRILRISDSRLHTSAAILQSQQTTKETKNWQKALPNVVLLDAVRTPFVLSNTVYGNLMAVDLQRHALKTLIQRTQVPYEDIGHITCGTVIQECNTSNIAREAALTAGFPNTVPCSTVTLACISSSLALHNIASYIKSGYCEAGIAGGVEFLSDVPIRHNREARSSMLNLSKAKTTEQKVKHGLTIAKNLLNPEVPSIKEYTTNETMGQSADRLAGAFNISRKDQDEFAIRSHTLADKAAKAGKLTDVEPIFVLNGKNSGSVSVDNGIRVSTMEHLTKLKPAFIKPHGTITAGNSSYLTDGASAALITSEEYALRNGYKPKAFLRDTLFVAQDPKDQLLLSPAYVIPRILEKNGLSLRDVDVFEIHEAFAGQVLANLAALDSDYFCKTCMKRSGKFGTIPFEKLNLWGGSLSLGHPFGATGVRLLAHAANRLREEGSRYAVIAACAAGGHGVGMLIEAYQN